MGPIFIYIVIFYLTGEHPTCKTCTTSLHELEKTKEENITEEKKTVSVGQENNSFKWSLTARKMDGHQAPSYFGADGNEWWILPKGGKWL